MQRKRHQHSADMGAVTAVGIIASVALIVTALFKVVEVAVLAAVAFGVLMLMGITDGRLFSWGPFSVITKIPFYQHKQDCLEEYLGVDHQEVHECGYVKKGQRLVAKTETVTE